MVPTMKAAALRGYGEPDVLRLEDVPRPEPGPGEVLVRVRGAAINPVDFKTRSGKGLSGRYQNFPVILGWDIAGEVVEIGEAGDGSAGFAPGDAVYGLIRFPEQGRAYAEYATAPAAHLAPAPKTLSPLEAAAVPLAALTAWQALFEGLDLQAGETILIHAAAGGVVHFAVQLAHWKGARVIGTASAANAEFVRGLGAAEAVDYTRAPFEESVRGVDAVLDTVGGEVRERSLATLRPGGRLISIVGPAMPEETARERGVSARNVLVYPSGAQLAEITARIDAGSVRPTVSAVLPLAEAAEAHRRSESGKTRGKIVLAT
jgi:NADPH2:quinone reductase